MFSKKQIIILCGIMTGMFLSALEISVVGTAAPRIVREIGGFSSYSWIFSIYLATSSITMPFWGRCADHYGRKNVFLASMILFMLGSLFCGYSPNFLSLIIFRGIQGIGAGGLVPIAFTIVADTFEINTRTKLQGWFGSIWGVATLIGPFIGGIITDHWGWRWIFFLNIMPGFISVFIIMKYYEETTTPESNIKLNIPSILLSLFAMISLLVSLDFLQQRDWHYFLIFLTSLILCLYFFVVFERKTQFPLIPKELFRHKLFITTCVSGFFSSAIILSLSSFIPLMFQLHLKYSPTASGLMLLPLTVSWILFGMVSAQIMLKVEYRKLLLLGFTLFVIGLAALALFFNHLNFYTASLSLAIMGAGMAFNYPIVLIATQYSVPKHLTGFVTSGIFWIRNIGGTTGVSLIGFLMIYFIDHFIDTTVKAGQIRHTIQIDKLLQPETLEILAKSPDLSMAISKSLFLSICAMLILATFNLFLLKRFPKLPLKTQDKL